MIHDYDLIPIHLWGSSLTTNEYSGLLLQLHNLPSAGIFLQWVLKRGFAQ